MLRSDRESGWLLFWALLAGTVLMVSWRFARSASEASLREFLGEGPAGARGALALLGAAAPGLAATAWAFWAVPRPLIGDFLLRLAFLYLGVMLFEETTTRFHLRRRVFALRDQVLRSRLAPHFLFNTLATLRAQMDADPAGAKATADRLAQLFRELLELSATDTISLGRELGFVEAYLGIERARMGRRLQVTIAIPEALESAQVPPMALQVLVENAVKHGIAGREEGGSIRIGAALAQAQAGTLLQEERQDLDVWVEDSGDGHSEHQGSGTALQSLRLRLAKPEDLTMSRTESGFRVAFRWRQA
ncbi:MAG TPA: histidine kinase [Geothrix sp.]|nr:histidine kinase [Geothrix sp.]